MFHDIFEFRSFKSIIRNVIMQIYECHNAESLYSWRFTEFSWLFLSIVYETSDLKVTSNSWFCSFIIMAFDLRFLKCHVHFYSRDENSHVYKRFAITFWIEIVLSRMNLYSHHLVATWFIKYSINILRISQT